MPPEFLGKARTLRSRVLDEHSRWQPFVTAFVHQARPRPGFSRVKATRLAEIWKALPGSGARLGITTSARPGHLRIAELRLLPTRMRFGSWPDDAEELAITVASVTLGMQGDAFVCDRHLIADVGLHALGRRYERGTDRVDAAVLADLERLAHTYEAAVMNGGTFNISGWRGDVCAVEGTPEPVLSVRTFVP